MINSFEHTDLEDIFGEEQLKAFNSSYAEQDPKYLGLHQEFDSGVMKLRSHYYIGYRWIDDACSEYIHISPKKESDHQADYLKMFLCCLKDPIVSKQLDETYKIFFNEEWIEIKEEKDEITPLIILQFLHLVKDISKKGLKKGYVKVTENLTAKMKGKILIDRTIKQDHFKNRMDKAVCTHQVFTINCIENRILKTALLQCSRYLFGIGEEVEKLLRINLGAFELVESKEVFDSDFKKIKHSPFYKDYKHALVLAQMIFKRFGFTLNAPMQKHTQKIPPFYIDMPELFERYVEVKLRGSYGEKLKPGYGKEHGNSYTWGLRPDFIIKKRNLIIDAKYKYWFKADNEDQRFKDDLQQLSLYGREKKIREKIGLSENEEAQIVFVYPKKSGKEVIDHDHFEKVEKFNNIYKIGIDIPLKELDQ